MDRNGMDSLDGSGWEWKGMERNGMERTGFKGLDRIGKEWNG